MDRTFLLVLVLSFLILSPLAEANCRNKKPICGNQNICHSDQRGANRNDLNQPLHGTICKVLNNMERKFGKLEILSAYRANNAARGGATRSMHLREPGGPTLAVDVYRPAARRQMYQFLAGEKCQGIRYNIYCDTGTIHVDTAGRRLGDNYSGCRDFVRGPCVASSGNEQNPPQQPPRQPPVNPPVAPPEEPPYKSPAVEQYRRRTPAGNLITRCWNIAKWGTCCGPARKRNGYCTGE